MIRHIRFVTVEPWKNGEAVGLAIALSTDRAPGDCSWGSLHLSEVHRRDSGHLHVGEAHRGPGCLQWLERTYGTSTCVELPFFGSSATTLKL